jgi:hypothetical protein
MLACQRPGTVHVGFVFDKVAIRKVFQVLQLSPVNIIPPLLLILMYYLGDEQQAC